MYKRLGSARGDGQGFTELSPRSGEPSSSPPSLGASPADNVDKIKKKGATVHTRKPRTIALFMLAALLGIALMRKAWRISSEAPVTVEVEAGDVTVSKDESVESHFEGFTKHLKSAKTFFFGSEEDGEEQSGENADQGEIMAETDERNIELDKAASIDWEEIMAQAPSRQEQVEKEWGITLDSPFFSLEEFKDMIGFRCPAGRHCSVKKAASMFYGGGAWTQNSSGEGLIWNPHNCWMYQFKGGERWVAQSAANKLVVFLDGETGNQMVEEAAGMNTIFNYIKVALPESSSAFQKLNMQLDDLVKDKGVDRQSLDVLIVTNWVVPLGNEVFLTRLLYRLGAQLDVHSVRTLWLAEPFTALPGSGKTVLFNEAMGEALKDAVKTKQGSLFIQKKPLNNQLKGPSPKGFLSAEQLAEQASESVLFDARNDPKPFTEPFLEYFNKYGHTYGLANLLNGVVPNLHLDTKIVVYCSSGSNAIKMAKILLGHGFKNVSPMAVGRLVDGEISEDFPKPITIRENTYVLGIDTFAPSIGAPDDIAVPGNSTLMGRFVANTVLNELFRAEIVATAKFSDTHICHTEDSCSSCFVTVGSISSERVNFETIHTYLLRRNTPHKIALSDRHKVWDGDWVTFLKRNQKTSLFVRSDYSSVMTRKFVKQTVPAYLQRINILRKTESGFEETGEAPVVKKEGALPEYAGNNKLTPSSMASSQFRYPEWIRKTSFERPAMWLGPKGSLSSLHVDHSNKGNFAFQILGKKKWQLFPPRNRPFMFGRKVGVVVWAKLIDPSTYSPEVAKTMPAFKLAIPESISIEVNQGEMLFNPNEWWHVVYNVEASLMVNFWLDKNAPLLPGNPNKSKPINNKPNKPGGKGNIRNNNNKT